MTTPDISDWVSPVAPSVNLITVQSVAALSGQIPITAGLLPQSTGVAIAVVFKAGNASSGVNWQIQDNTLSRALTLNTVYNAGNPGLQSRPFPGAYVQQNPANDLELNYGTINAGVIVADIYVYGLSQFPVEIPQVGLNGWSGLQAIAPINVLAGATTTVLPAPFSGQVNRILTLCANHTIAAAAVARVSWINGIGGNSFLTTLDTAVANFVWNNTGPFDTVLDLQYQNGTSQPHQIIVGYQVGPQ